MSSKPEATIATITPPGGPVTPSVTPPPGMPPNTIVRTYRVHGGPVTHNKVS